MIVFEERNAILEDCDIGAHSLFQTWPFSTKIGEIGAHSFFENWPFATKRVLTRSWLCGQGQLRRLSQQLPGEY